MEELVVGLLGPPRAAPARAEVAREEVAREDVAGARTAIRVGIEEPDAASFDGFVAARWTALVRTAFLVTGDRGTAEDCVQDALVRVHRHWARVAAGGSPEAYARRAVLNAALSWRRRRRVKEVPLDGVGEGGEPAGGGAELASSGLDVDLIAALRSLPPRMRAVIVLRVVEDRSETETAQLLGCSVGTVKSTVSRGLVRLRGLLGPMTADGTNGDAR